MRIIILALIMAALSLGVSAQEISSVETRGSWIYIYNGQGKKSNTLSLSTVGTVVGYSSSFFVSEKGSWIYLWDADGKKIGTMSKSTVGDVIGVAGDTFTSRKGSWIYTWDKKGKKINTRAAR